MQINVQQVLDNIAFSPVYVNLFTNPLCYAIIGPHVPVYLILHAKVGNILQSSMAP